MNKNEAAKAAGLRVYDEAVPQQWIDDTAVKIAKVLYVDRDVVYLALLAGVVWCYDDAKIFGAPVAVTDEAEKLKQYF